MTSEEEKFRYQNSLNIFLNTLDEKSRKIYWYFRCHGHAKLAELTQLIGATADMEALYRIREIINPAAIKNFGKPLLEFSKSRLDRITGNKMPFHWWLSNNTKYNALFTDEFRKPLVDFFDEEDKIIIISEISPSITVNEIAAIEQRNGILYIKLDKLP
jgi:hypothetical protein